MEGVVLAGLMLVVATGATHAPVTAIATGGAADDTMRARLIGPGNAAELQHQLLQGDAPGHEWGLSAGVLLVGSLKGLGFVRELVGL